MPLAKLSDLEFALRIDSQPSPAPNHPTLSTRKKVLYIEDNPDNAEVVRRALQRNYTVLYAANGLTGLTLAERHLPDFILLDIHLPDLNGFEVAQRLRELANRRQRQISIIALTGDSSAETQRRVQEAGFNFYLTKPVDFPELWQRLADPQLNVSTGSAA